MEGLIGFIVLVIIFIVIRNAVRSNSNDSQTKTTTRKPTRTTAKKRSSYKTGTSTKSRSVKKNIYDTVFRVVDKPMEMEDGTEFDALQFEMKGMIPIPSNLFCSNCDKKYSEEDKYCTNCGSNVGITIAVSIFDDQNRLPFISYIDVFQEKSSRAYLYLREIGNVQKGFYYPTWYPVGFAVKESLVPPRSGTTTLRIIYRFIETGIESRISGGYVDESNIKQIYSSYGHPKTKVSKLTLDLDVEGYLDLGDNSKKAHKQALILGIELALIDDEMHDAEGNVIKEWMGKYVESFTGEEKESIKSEMNATMRRSYKDVNSKKINREHIIKELLSVGKKADFKDTMELLVDIMAADEEAHKNELDFINQVGDDLGVSAIEIQKMKDLRFLNKDGLEISEINSDAILGIDPDKMTKEQICQHLRTEYNKWNSRLQSVTDPDKRSKTQARVDSITAARIKYCE